MELDAILTHTTALEGALTSFRRNVAHQLTATGGGIGLGLTIPSQLQEFEERLSQILLQSRNLRNTLSSRDGALPDDVLYLILEQACVVQADPPPSPWNHSSIFYGTSLFSASTARKLSDVCRRWRSLLLSNPIAWSDVSMTIRRAENLSWLEACLTRGASSSAGCMIRIVQPAGFPIGADVTEVLSRRFSNIRCLKINPRTKADYDFLLFKMENLERLHIKAGTLSRAPVPSASHLGKLRVVILQRLPTIPSRVFFNITDLTLQNIVSPVDNLVDVLQTNQTLEAVRINNTVVAEDPQRRLISLPNLKILCISYSSPVVVLGMLSPLSTPSRAIVCDDPAVLIASGISDMLRPFLMFGPNDPVLAASISMLLEEASITFHTDAGATFEIITQAGTVDVGYPPVFRPLLEAASLWGPFPGLRSMHLQVERTTTGPINTALIHILLSRTPSMTRLSFKGHTLCLHICQALAITRVSGMVCPELEYLGGTLYPDDHVVDSLRSLSVALKDRPAIREVALDVLLQGGEVEGVLADIDPLIKEIKSHGVHAFSLTPITEWV